MAFSGALFSPWEQLPVDLVVEITTHLPFTPSTLLSLLLVNKRTHDIVTHYEHCLSKAIGATQFPTAALVFPPPTLLLPEPLSQPSFRWLSLLAHRTATISALIAKTTSLSQETTYPLPHQTAHWNAIQRGSLLLLYRLSDQPTQSQKVSFLLSLPLYALALLHLELYLAIKIAEEVGEGIINASFARNDTATRSDICLVFGELLLKYGPRFLNDVLGHKADAAQELHSEWMCLDSYQIDGAASSTTYITNNAPGTVTQATTNTEDDDNDDAAQGSTDPRKRTLTSYLREAFWRRDGCGVQQTSTKMWSLVQSPVLWNMDEAILRHLVLGIEADWKTGI
ncbi:MAG: hypothetical protein M1819_000072 [Sarea resinae]|nr:MAG: hypothetical protein M1819_000072 [Sarea resinae]